MGWLRFRCLSWGGGVAEGVVALGGSNGSSFDDAREEVLGLFCSHDAEVLDTAIMPQFSSMYTPSF